MINRYLRTLLLVAAGTGFAATQAPAQTDAQRNAIKSACRSDYMSKCSSVPPGGAPAFQCLQKNMASLSSSCQTAVRALEPAADPKPAAETKPASAPAVAAKPPAAPAPPAAAEAPKPAVEAPKAAAQPVAPAAPPQAAAKTEPVKPPASSAAKPAAKPSEAEVAAIRSACGSDYRKVCSSVPPGGAAALQCLEQNKTKVSASCAKAIAAASGDGAAVAAAPSTPATTAAVPATAAASPPAAPAMVLRPLRPLEELRIVRAACGPDARAFCSSVEPGGGRVAQCLAANAGSLSTACKSMLASFAAN
ncbi:hypothetical protein SSBR45G_31620 [Bradyrhizobium sp. SSBR45G]|uniref:cysteine rich repeat-containing protein n=1 Tax=unclassified Bradyrhizobium TaxID=2631580 RepID=UPI0023429242|nr:MULTISPECIES: cysteine rich repeat-containing protein [unclassified Bradyrhizobium]GLH78253.1 hypothetical protein SSBR45G_31620 [Bradyrhizobium sp. SSBR45G]GLH85980.1 hypothetical protein SSBR45R_34400 [Bradyrhizobium sp. SSBR45R]